MWAKAEAALKVAELVIGGRPVPLAWIRTCISSLAGLFKRARTGMKERRWQE